MAAWAAWPGPSGPCGGSVTAHSNFSSLTISVTLYDARARVIFRAMITYAHHAMITSDSDSERHDRAADRPVGMFDVAN